MIEAGERLHLCVDDRTIEDERGRVPGAPSLVEPRGSQVLRRILERVEELPVVEFTRGREVDVKPEEVLERLVAWLEVI